MISSFFLKSPHGQFRRQQKAKQQPELMEQAQVDDVLSTITQTHIVTMTTTLRLCCSHAHTLCVF